MSIIFNAKILVTTDFSDASYAAFPYALDRSKEFNSPITLVNCLKTTPLVFSFEHVPYLEEIESLKKAAIAQADMQLKTIANDYFSGLQIQSVVLDSLLMPADAIVEYAVKEKFGLLIIATHGHGLAGRVLLGSVAERILRQAPCPVLAVPCRAESHKLPVAHLPCGNILVTTDFSDASRAALPIALSDAGRTGAKITIAYVSESPYALASIQSRILFKDKLEEMEKSYKQGLEKKMEEFIAPVKDQIFSCQILEKKYSVANSIAEYLKSAKVNLLVISTRGSTNRLNWFGGVVERVLEQSPCPVLVVPAGSN